MRTIPSLLSVLLVAGALAPGAAQAQEAEGAADEVTIFRCTDAQGRLALQDFPCAEGEQQQVRTMARPQDPAPRPGAEDAPPAPSATAAPQPVQVVVRNPARPMYECITPDGERYTSDSGDGNPRPAPSWGGWGWGGAWMGSGHGMQSAPRRSPDRRSAGIASPGMSTSPGPSLAAPPPPSQGTRPPPPPRPPAHRYPPAYAYGGSDGWIRDQCHPLPQGDVCSLLGDRRGDIRRRMFNAQPSERAALREEDRTITARLNEDCDIR